MHSFFTTLLGSLLFFPVGCFASGPRPVFDHTAHHFGVLMQGDRCEHDFVLTNAGSEPLIIESCMTSCGCDVPSWSREPVMPGRTTLIHYLYDSKRLGPFTKTMTVRICGIDSLYTLKVCGTITNGLEFFSDYTERNGSCSCPRVKSNESMAPLFAKADHMVSDSLLADSIAFSSPLYATETAMDSLGAVLGGELNWNVYPVPTAQWVHLQWERKVSEGRIHIYDSGGRFIRNAGRLSGTSASLDLSDLAIGTYIVHAIVDNTIIATARIVLLR